MHRLLITTIVLTALLPASAFAYGKYCYSSYSSDSGASFKSSASPNAGGGARRP